MKLLTKIHNTEIDYHDFCINNIIRIQIFEDPFKMQPLSITKKSDSVAFYRVDARTEVEELIIANVSLVELNLNNLLKLAPISPITVDEINSGTIIYDKEKQMVTFATSSSEYSNIDIHLLNPLLWQSLEGKQTVPPTTDKSNLSPTQQEKKKMTAQIKKTLKKIEQELNENSYTADLINKNKDV